ncbi:hypothetical protein REH81_05070 [Vibrio rotiferianus]
MLIANLGALKKTVQAAIDTLEWMKTDPHKINCLEDAHEYLDEGHEDLKTDGIDKGIPSAAQSMEKALKRLQLAKEYCINSNKDDGPDVVNDLIIAQCNAIIPILDSTIEKALAR